MDADDKAEPTASKGYKSRRVTSSVPAADVMALVDVLDEAFVLNDMIQVEITNNMLFHRLIDSISLFKIISKNGRSN